MVFFPNKKKNTPSNNEAEHKNTIVLKCPECNFTQSESSMAVSTYCRSCGIHYNISNGKAVSNKQVINSSYRAFDNRGQNLKLRSTNHLIEEEQTPTKEKRPNNPRTENITKTPELTTDRSSTGPKTQAAKLIRKAATSAGLIQNQSQGREVKCFDCETVHRAPDAASSTLCPSCGSYISLKDHEILTNWNRGIQTRGDVIIHKKAKVTGITIQCHHLTTQGDFTGGVDCSGDFTIRNHGKIMGEIKCRRLIVEKRTQVEFVNTIECEDAIIDGTVTGNFKCSGKLSLQKKATLTGDIQVTTMSIEEGASHHGNISIGQE